MAVPTLPGGKRTSVTLATPVPGSDDMDVPAMQLELHERGSHVV